MSIFTNFSKVEHNLITDLVAFLKGPFWAFIAPTVKLVESQGGAILVAAAENAVAIGFATTGGGQVAMAAALKSFESEIVAKGLPFVESEARLLIEAALQKAKASVPASTIDGTANPVSAVLSLGQ
jgi:hypothetical protein